MREKGSDYFENSRRATYVQREYALRNPHEFEGYGKNAGAYRRRRARRRTLKIDGRRAALFRLCRARRALWARRRHDRAHARRSRRCRSRPRSRCRRCAIFVSDIPRWPGIADCRAASIRPCRQGASGWVSEGYFGLDQGIVVMMIENYRSQLIWNLMRRVPLYRRADCTAQGSRADGCHDESSAPREQADAARQVTARVAGRSYQSRIAGECSPARLAQSRTRGKYNLVDRRRGAGRADRGARRPRWARKSRSSSAISSAASRLNVGCVPSKAIIRTSRLYAEMRDAENFGAPVPGGIDIDFPAVDGADAADPGAPQPGRTRRSD